MRRPDDQRMLTLDAVRAIRTSYGFSALRLSKRGTYTDCINVRLKVDGQIGSRTVDFEAGASPNQQRFRTSKKRIVFSNEFKLSLICEILVSSDVGITY